MVSCSLLIAATLAAAGDAVQPLMVSAAKSKPTNPWENYSTRLVDSLPDYHSISDGALSTYGGIKSEKLTATGFFRVEKIGRRWWLVDPEGCRFIHMGVVAVAPEGSKENWARETSELLHANGFNGTGAWSDTDTLRKDKQPMVYTKLLNFMSSYGSKRGGMYQQAGHMGYPNDCIFVFDPEFPAFCEKYAQQLAASKNDPWLLGYFSDNELPFYENTLENFLKLDESDPGRKAVNQWLAERRQKNPEEQSITREMRADFLGFMTDRYLQITTDAIRKHDPNHLCLGPRFFFTPEKSKPLYKPFFQAAGRHLDVVAINYYLAWSPDPEQTRNWVEWSGKPFIVTEWYAKGMDTGLANTTGAGWVVKTQEDRGRFYQNFTLGLLESRGCVGWHWFKWRDNDPNNKKAEPSNRDSNKGMVDLHLKPYLPLTNAMSEVNRQVYSLADYFDKANP
jgi:hypothetical protein